MSETISTIYFQTYQTPVGPVTIEAGETAITGIRTNQASYPDQDHQMQMAEQAQKQILIQNRNQKPGWILNQETTLIFRAYEELMEYFSGKRRYFDLPLHVSGTDFQMQVWKALQEIPYRETRTYKEIAIKTGRPKACRAVGGACHRNPILIMIPCHRVIGADGSLTGFGGGIPVKKQLLALEQDAL